MNKKFHSVEEADEQRQNERAKWGNPAKVRFNEAFFDGTLAPFFTEIGQDPHVAPLELRELPVSLLERCIQSGAQVEIVVK